MSRIARNPISLSKGIEVKFDKDFLEVNGTKGSLKKQVPALVDVSVNSSSISFAPKDNSIGANAMSGTIWALVNGMVHGVTNGFEKKLTLVGVGYRAQLQGKTLNLSLGFSHPVNYEIPEGIKIETPSQTEIIVKGIDKQLVGQVAANIRGYRPPEPYKGKGIRYSDEVIIQKEAKKK
jgi:large subunit ribosomal protein L6